jgi:hypothetical protein
MTGAVQRRLRSSRARNRLWYAANGVCTRCGVPLPATGWHADHVVPGRIPPAFLLRGTQRSQAPLAVTNAVAGEPFSYERPHVCHAHPCITARAAHD